MAMQYDVLAEQLTDSGTVANARYRLKSVYALGGESAATITFTDGNGGPTRLVLSIPPDTFGSQYILFPGEGILFQTSIYLVNADAVSVTAFYG